LPPLSINIGVDDIEPLLGQFFFNLLGSIHKVSRSGLTCN